MFGTCNGGGRSFACLFYLALVGLIVLSFLQCSELGRCSRDNRTLAQVVLTTPTCASAAPSDIRS